MGKAERKAMEASLAMEFRAIVKNEELLKQCTEGFYNSIIDKLTLGIIFDMHRKHKMKRYDLLNENYFDDHIARNIILGHETLRTSQELLTCPFCPKLTTDPKSYAKHLADCMGVGRKKAALRNAHKRLNNNQNNKDRKEDFGYSSPPSDDEKDMTWESDNGRRKKANNKRGNGKKRKGKISKNQL